ncbi:MAG TPA: hypothetical protein VIT62_08360 [Lysobacter sp.]
MKLDRTLLLILALIAATTLVYWPGLGGGFLLDDYPNIVTNPRVQPSTLTVESMMTAARSYDAGFYNRPLPTISFAIDYLHYGKNPWGYKLTGLIVHLLNSLLVFFLVRKLLALTRVEAARSSTTTSFVIALLWAIHPIQISSVLYIVQRMETMSLTFVLLALLAYLKGRSSQIEGRAGWPWLAACAGLVIMGLLCKETAALFPAYALALELTALRFEASSPARKRWLVGFYAGGTALAAALFLLVIVPHFATADAFANRDFTAYERVLTQLRVLPMHLGQMILPAPGRMTFYYDAFPASHGLLAPYTTLLGGLLIAGLIASAWALRKRAPLAALGVFWFFAAHLITSNVFNLELVFEHRNYFALLGFLLTASEIWRKVEFRDSPSLKVFAVAAIVVGVGTLAIIRSATWGHPVKLAVELVAKNPTSPRASSDLGAEYVNLSGSDPASPYFAMAYREFERGSRLPNASPLLDQGLILMAATTGQTVEDRWWLQLIEKIKLRPIGSQEVAAVNGLMVQRYKGVPLDDSRLSEAYATLLSRRKMPPQFYVQYGDFALTYLHDEDLADRMFVTAIENAGGDSQYALQIFSGLVADGRKRQAKAVYAKATSLGLIKAASKD